ncbi:MAG: hypothetical protein WBI82_03305 [Sphaerochaeta sp.]
MPPFPPQGAMYLTLLSRHSLGNGTMVMLVLLSLRWGINHTWLDIGEIPTVSNRYFT